MAKDDDRLEAMKVARELRQSAGRLMKRSHELADEAVGLKRHADDLEQLVKQRDRRKRK